jgi:type VI secretion system protein ImpI
VAAGLIVRILDTKTGAQEERSFGRFPVRIGRNELNDLRLDSPFVSQFHAVIESHQGKVELRDLGSLNGTLLRGSGRAPANTPIDLAPYGGEFAIVSLIVQTHAIDVESSTSYRRQGKMLGLASAERRDDFGDTTQAGVNLGLDLLAAKAISQLQPLYKEARDATSHLLRSIEGTLEQFDHPTRARALVALRDQMPHVEREPEFKRLLSAYGIDEGGGSTLDAFALRALMEMLAVYVPGIEPPETVDELAMFMQCLQDTLDVFMRGFVRLQEGHKQFEAQMDIRRGSSEGFAASVETASTQEELARVLLDFRNGSPDAPRDVEGAFADLMIHQVALLNGVMNGVKSLLAELSPSAIERYAEDPRRRGGGGLQIGPFRYRQLWELYAERHSDLADEEREAFGLIFGPDFSRAYAQFRRSATGQAWSTMTSRHDALKK